MNGIKEFLKTEAAGGVVLLAAAIVAFILDNSPITALYQAILHTPLVIQVWHWRFAASSLSLINEGLMTIFFVLVGLELKREFMEGELSQPAQILLPGISALGGMVIPALIYLWMTYPDLHMMKGWATPVATDIAFALGVLSLLGKRVSLELKLFLLTLAIFDDIGAILIIAVLYSQGLSGLALLLSVVCLLMLWLFNKWQIQFFSLYAAVGILLWFFVLESGVHVTVGGILFAFMIPIRSDAKQVSMLHNLEKTLHPWVVYGILPLFALANAGVSLQKDWITTVMSPVTMGVVLGLLLGKPAGVFSFAWAFVKLGWTKLPAKMTWPQLFGIAALCGIGFTMSLFLGTLAFEQSDSMNIIGIRFGVLLGSLLSGVAGIIILHYAVKNRRG